MSIIKNNWKKIVGVALIGGSLFVGKYCESCVSVMQGLGSQIIQSQESNNKANNTEQVEHK